ncbi:hypothetical protein BDV93DRAFT_513706 [Ceratobasidium sp. AG-I]|nr:hypothetical protein BDV93DRAFT_513706 [Ceratobasidium sp. AG-I]
MPGLYLPKSCDCRTIIWSVGIPWMQIAVSGMTYALTQTDLTIGATTTIASYRNNSLRSYDYSLTYHYTWVVGATRTVLTAKGNNTASWILDLFGGLVAIGLVAFGFVESVAAQLPPRWYFYLYTHAIYTWRFKTRSPEEYNMA